MNRLDIKEKLIARSEYRVKSVDLHPTEPWVLSSYFNGTVTIHDIKTKQIIKTFDVSDLPVRCAKFIPRKRWIITGSDDHCIRIYNYNTMEKEREFEAHEDYIRSIAVHPTKPYILTSSDDTTIRLWDWEDRWKCIKKFEGHSHYVMNVVFNPKDTNLFASCSLDGLIRIWNIYHSDQPNFTLQGHEKGINFIDFYYGQDKPFLISASDDMIVKIWDYQTKHCVQTLENHAHNVTCCCFHPKLPIIITGSEDHTINIYNSHTFKLLKTLNYSLERVWGLSFNLENSKLAVACDLGTLVLRLSKDNPIVTMDRKGKITFALNNEIQQITIKEPVLSTTTSDKSTSDNNKDNTTIIEEHVTTTSKDMGCIDIYPEQMVYDHKGRFISAVGGGDFIIYTSISMRSKTYGNGEELVWSNQSGQYAVRTKQNEIKIYKDFKEVKVFKPFFNPKQIFGGHLLGICSNEFICFYDWDTCQMIRNISVVPRKVYWNEDGDYVLFATENEFYILKFNLNLVKSTLKLLSTSTTKKEEDVQIEESLILEHHIEEKIREGQWVGECFIYTNNDNRLNYLIGGEITTITILDDSKHYFLGYVTKHNRIYIMDKDRNITSYKLYINVLNYETAIIRGDLNLAKNIITTIPKEEYNKLAKFLDLQGYKELALEVSQDNDHKFNIAIQLNKLDIAYQLIKDSHLEEDDLNNLEMKWKQLGQLALSQYNLKLSEECFINGKDYGALLLLYSSTGNLNGLKHLVKLSTKNNITFMCYYLLNDLNNCINLLIESNRIPEAALFARTYCPKEMSRVVKIWREDLKKGSNNDKLSNVSSQRLKSIAEALADPEEYPNLFNNYLNVINNDNHSIVVDTIVDSLANENNTLVQEGLEEKTKEE
ncbi:hypothetical protein ABK040_001362 [Willaertia magna]